MDKKIMLTCDICYNEYDETDKIPRILSCGHTFCTQCIKRFLEEKSSCPTCVKVIKHERIEDIPINFLAMSLLENESTEDSEESEDLESQGQCSKHSSPFHFYCMTCEDLICGICVGLKHNKNCRTLKIQNAVHITKKRKLDRTEQILKQKQVEEGKILKSIDILKNRLENERKTKALYQSNKTNTKFSELYINIR